MISRVIVLAAIVVTALPCFAQKPVKTVAESRDITAQELEEILSTADKLDDRMAKLTVKSRAAMLVSFFDSVRAEKMFLTAWKFANEQTDESFDREQAKLIVLKYLYARNPKLARQLLAQLPAKESSPRTRAMGGDNDQQFSSKLASELMEADPSIAAALLEKSLSIAVTPAGVGTLARLRQMDCLLADYLAAKIVDGLTLQPTLVSLPAFPLLAAYVFPSPAADIPSPEAQSSLQTLQFRYFLTGVEVLRSSLIETTDVLVKEQRYTPPDLTFRAANQGLLAAILAALAPRFQPVLAPELGQIAAKLRSQVPQNIAQMSQIALTRLSGNELTSDDPNQKFALALSNGDLDEARKQLERLPDGKQKDAYTQLLIRNEARARLAESDVMGALAMIRKLDDQNARLVMYLDALKIAKKKRDGELTKVVVNEARLLVPQTGRNGLHIRALLSFSFQLTTTDAQADAAEFLASAVTSINGLTTRSKDEAEPQTMAEAAMVELNDPTSLLDASEMEQAFSAIGLIDLDRALTEAKRIDLRSAQLVARLEALQGIIKLNFRGSKTPAKSPKVLSIPR